MKKLLLLLLFFSTSAASGYSTLPTALGGSFGYKMDPQSGGDLYLGLIVGKRELFSSTQAPITGLLIEGGIAVGGYTMTLGAVFKSRLHVRYTTFRSYYEDDDYCISRRSRYSNAETNSITCYTPLRSRSVSTGVKLGILEINIGLMRVENENEITPFLGIGLGI